MKFEELTQLDLLCCATRFEFPGAIMRKRRGGDWIVTTAEGTNTSRHDPSIRARHPCSRSRPLRHQRSHETPGAHHDRRGDAAEPHLHEQLHHRTSPSLASQTSQRGEHSLVNLVNLVNIMNLYSIAESG